MRLTAEQARGVQVYDLEENKYVPCWLWVDTDAGMLEAFYDPLKMREDGAFATYTAKGRFRLVAKREVKAAPELRIAMGAQNCVKCGAALTLRGSELCVGCNARDKNYKFPSKLTNPFAVYKCELCSRRATWSVSDEVQVSPAVGTGVLFGVRGKLLFDRGATVGRRYYCAFCYKPPRVLDAKGEVIETIADAGGVRPQWHS